MGIHPLQPCTNILQAAVQRLEEAIAATQDKIEKVLLQKRGTKSSELVSLTDLHVAAEQCWHPSPVYQTALRVPAASLALLHQ
jgi:hypothetical protein